MYIKYSLKKMLAYNYLKYLVYIWIIMLIFLVVEKKAIDSASIMGIHCEIGVSYFLIKIFAGLEKYTAGVGIRFQVPYIWLICYVFLCYLVGDYFSLQGSAFDNKSVVFSGKRRKMLWAVIVAALINEMIIGLSFTVICGLYGVIHRGNIEDSIRFILLESGQDFTPLLDRKVMFNVTAMIILGTFVIILLQSFLCILFGGKIAYIVSTLSLVVGTYYKSPILPGNYCMILRNANWCYKGMNLAVCIVFTAAYSLLVIVALSCRLKRQDYR